MMSDYGCLSQVSKAALTPETSYIARPASSWLDDFLVWLSPDSYGCCQKFPDGSYCSSNDKVKVLNVENKYRVHLEHLEYLDMKVVPTYICNQELNGVFCGFVHDQ